MIAILLIIAGIVIYIDETGSSGKNYPGIVIGATKIKKYYVVKFECDGEIKKVKTNWKKPDNSDGKLGKKVMVNYDERCPDICYLVNGKKGIIMILAGIALLCIEGIILALL